MRKKRNNFPPIPTFYSYVEEQWIQKCFLFILKKSAGLILKLRVSTVLSSNELAGNVLLSVFFKLKSVGRDHQ